MLDEVAAALRTIESAAGASFGYASDPLLVSCRSGAKFSMPGMMDTVLNLGMNDSVAEGLVRLTDGDHFVHDSYRRLVQMFGSVVLESATIPSSTCWNAIASNAESRVTPISPPRTAAR
ncbi:MAG: hypothetical protein ACFCU2_03295 [Acidimicrobiia bacterium]